jgi:hypothetical protein
MDESNGSYAVRAAKPNSADRESMAALNAI